MAKLYTLRSGATSHPESSVLQFVTDLIKTAGVLSLSNNHFKVEAQATPDMTVKVKQGRAYLKTSTSDVYPVRSDGDIDVSIASNSSGNDRIDAVVLYVDLAASANSDASNVAKLTVVQGTPSASPSAPSDADIQSAIGASNPFLRLANITVANGATSITNSDISDTRVEVNQASLIKDNLRLNEQSSTPTPPASGKYVVYVKSDGYLYYIDDTGTERRWYPPIVDNDIAYQGKDSSGTARNVAKINASNVLEIGDSGLAHKFMNQYFFDVETATVQSVPSGGEIKLNLNTKNFDPANMFDATTNYRFNVPVSGYYEISASVKVESGSGIVYGTVKKNTTEYLFVMRNDNYAGQWKNGMTRLVKLNSGDYVELFIYQGSGANQNCSGWMSGRLLSAI